MNLYRGSLLYRFFAPWLLGKCRLKQNFMWPSEASVISMNSEFPSLPRIPSPSYPSLIPYSLLLSTFLHMTFSSLYSVCHRPWHWARVHLAVSVQNPLPLQCWGHTFYSSWLYQAHALLQELVSWSPFKVSIFRTDIYTTTVSRCIWPTRSRSSFHGTSLHHEAVHHSSKIPGNVFTCRYSCTSIKMKHSLGAVFKATETGVDIQLRPTQKSRN